MEKKIKFYKLTITHSGKSKKFQTKKSVTNFSETLTELGINNSFVKEEKIITI